jgi:hypothetical protein
MSFTLSIITQPGGKYKAQDVIINRTQLTKLFQFSDHSQPTNKESKPVIKKLNTTSILEHWEVTNDLEYLQEG